MTRRGVDSTATEDQRLHRPAAQLGVSRHLTTPVEVKETTDDAVFPDHGVYVITERSNLAAVNDERSIEEEIDIESSNEEEDVGEISITLPSDSASEGLSSDLSLPHSFGHYDQLHTGRGMSHFDDHLTTLSPHQFPSRRVNRLQQNQLCGVEANVTTSEAVMKRFYEIQVGKIRAQLALSMQTQRDLEMMLKQERALWQKKEIENEQKFVKELDHLAKELKQTQANLEAAQTQLRMEKMHFATLQISDALAEQLSRQDEEDLSVREYIQLSIHSKVRKLEIELERCRQELELLKGTSDSDKFAAASALSKMNQVQRNAELSERRLQSELELLVATRNELENQIKTLLNQIDALKEKERQNEEMYSDQRGLVEESQRLKSDMEALQHENNELKLRFDKVSAEDSELRELVSMLTADKTFLLNAKTHLEDQMAKMKLSHDEMREKMKLLREKHDGHLDHSVQLQNETRLHFETKLNSEMTKFMELSKREIERIRNDGQLVYERENRLLKETRDDALKHVEMLQARLDSVQSALDEKVFESTRLESMHSTALATARNELKFQHFEMSQLKLTLEEKAMAVRNARLEIEMLTRKIETHKDEFTKLETTSTTRITQLEANLNVERNKLKEYELLEINLDDAILQTGEIAASKDSNEKTDDGSFLKLKEVVNTFGAIPTMKKRRFQQSVLLAQRLVKSQREAIALTQKLNEVISDRSRLQQEIIELKAQLASFHQPQSYLIEKLTRREQELQGAKRKHQEVQSQLQQLRVHYDQIREANLSLQHQLQQLLSRREDLDALKATVQLLRSKIDDSNEHKQLTYQLKLPLPRNSRSCATATDHCDAVSSSPVTSTVSKVFPSPSIFSKMTKSPTQVYKNEGVISFPVAPSSSNISCAPKWYTKLRCTSGDGQDINKSI